MFNFGEKDQDEDEEEDEDESVEKDSDEDEEEEDEDEGDEKAQAEEESPDEEVDEDREKKREENRRRRQEKKEFKRRKRDEELARLEALEQNLRAEREEKEHLKGFISKIAERIDSRDMSEIDGRMAGAEQRYREAQTFIQSATIQMQKAIELGDGEAWGRLNGEIKRAESIQAAADNEWRALKGVKEKLSSTRTEIPKQEQRQFIRDVDEVKERSFREDWIRQNSWFDRSANDKDSYDALVINKGLMDEGYRPDTQAFWNELSRRVKEKLPHKYRAAKKPPQLVGGRESTATKTGSNKEEGLDRAFIKVLNERYGYDKNNPDRKKAVASYLQGLKEYR